MSKEKLLIFILLLGIVFLVGKEVFSLNYRPSYQIEPYKKAYQGSQYTGGPGLIPDETVFLYAAGFYLQGGNPLKVNPEMPPLGKYLLGLSILFFNNTNQLIVLAGILSLVALYLLGKLILDQNSLALIPVFLFSAEKLFLNQFRINPLLDIIQLPFILLSFYFIIKAVIKRNKASYLTVGLILGFVISIKVMITGMLIFLSWVIFVLIQKKFQQLKNLFFIALPAAFLVLFISYIKVFVDNPSFWNFFLVQKWVFLYQQSKLQFPLSVWRLIFCNQWQTWWGDYRLLRAEEWWVVWPVATILTFTEIFYILVKRKKWQPVEMMIAVWICVYSLFLSLGTVSTRHLLPLLPFLYLVSTRFLSRFLRKIV